MKKILASVAAVAAVSSFASVAHAVGGGSSITGATSAESVHTGSAARTCDFNVTDGALPVATTLVTNLQSTTAGTISTVCNNTGSTLRVEIATHTPGTDDPGVGQAIIREYSLSGGTGAYTPVGLAFPATPAISPIIIVNDLSNGYSVNPSTVTVNAKVSAPLNQNLASGPYTVRVKATVTP